MSISVADLLSDSAEARFEQANALARPPERTASAHRYSLPVAVLAMVTKTDLLKGFMSHAARWIKPDAMPSGGFTFPGMPVSPISRTGIRTLTCSLPS
ncbi:type VI secretion protein IcmF/TssM N-terminal domain-containing protein [Pantoea ananatis]